MSDCRPYKRCRINMLASIRADGRLAPTKTLNVNALDLRLCVRSSFTADLCNYLFSDMNTAPPPTHTYTLTLLCVSLPPGDFYCCWFLFSEQRFWMSFLFFKCSHHDVSKAIMTDKEFLLIQILTDMVSCIVVYCKFRLAEIR